MTDPHMRILRRVARQRRVELEAHDAAHDSAGTEGRHQRLHLQQSATRATERVAEAQARRRWYGRRRLLSKPGSRSSNTPEIEIGPTQRRQ